MAVVLGGVLRVVRVLVGHGARRRVLLGAVAVVAGLLGTAAMAPAAFAGAVGVEASLPANAAASPGVVVGSVSCASAGNCTAVGYYIDSSGKEQGLLLTEFSGAWGRGVEALLPSNAGGEPYVNLGSVSCASAGNCTAVGYYTDSSGSQQGLLLSESSGSWAAGIEAPLPADASTNPEVDLRSVSCASAGNCAVVGNYGATVPGSSGQQGLLLSESSGTWTPNEAMLPADAFVNPSVAIRSVSCASAGNCTAVGDYTYYTGTSAGHRGLLFSELSGSWAPAVEAPAPANAAANPSVGLFSVSCASAGNCAAVGDYNDTTGRVQGLLLSQSSGAWAPGAEAVLPANAAGNPEVILGSVSCASAGACAAVGDYTDSSGNGQGLVLNESSGSWAPAVGAPLPANARAHPGHAFGSVSSLGSVSCAPDGKCAAAGDYIDNLGNGQGLLLGESAGVWAPGEAVLPANTRPRPLAEIGAVSCGAVGNCTAVGWYFDSSGHRQGLLESFGAAVPGPAIPAISKLGLLRHKVSVAGRSVHGRCVKPTKRNKRQRRCRRPMQLKIFYTLNTSASVTLTVRQKVRGRKVNSECVRQTKHNERRTRCARWVKVHGKVTQTARAGSHSFTFNGKLGRSTLAPGVYQLTAIPRANGHSGTPQQANFQIQG